MDSVAFKKQPKVVQEYNNIRNLLSNLEMPGLAQEKPGAIFDNDTKSS